MYQVVTFWVLFLEPIRSIDIQHRQVAGHTNQGAEDPLFRAGPQQGSVGCVFHLAAGIKDQSRSWLLGDKPGHIPILLDLYLDRLIGHSNKRSLVGVVVV